MCMQEGQNNYTLTSTLSHPQQYPVLHECTLLARGNLDMYNTFTICQNESYHMDLLFNHLLLFKFDFFFFIAWFLLVLCALWFLSLFWVLLLLFIWFFVLFILFVCLFVTGPWYTLTSVTCGELFGCFYSSSCNILYFDIVASSFCDHSIGLLLVLHIKLVYLAFIIVFILQISPPQIKSNDSNDK